MKKITIKRLVFIAIFGAISAILYTVPIFQFKLVSIFPSFLEINFSMLPVIIATFMLGPVDGIMVVLIRFFIKLPLSSSMFIGEFCDLFLGTIVCIISGLIYHKTNLKHKAFWSFLSVLVSWVLFGVVLNAFFNIPLYKAVMNLTDEIIAGLCSVPIKAITFGLVSNVNADNYLGYYLVFSTIPFNIFISTIVIIVTALVHNRLKDLYNKIN